MQIILSYVLNVLDPTYCTVQVLQRQQLRDTLRANYNLKRLYPDVVSINKSHCLLSHKSTVERILQQHKAKHGGCDFSAACLLRYTCGAAKQEAPSPALCAASSIILAVSSSDSPQLIECP
jgi:hypothetical protein